MAITLIINNIPFDYPEQGEQAPWGEAATGWAQEVTTVLNSIVNGSDILETTATILNNQTSTPVTGFFFDPSVVRSFKATGIIIREYNQIQLKENFEINGLNTGSEWLIQQEGLFLDQDCGVEFNLDPSGQMLYTSSNLTNYISGVIKFKASTILRIV